MGHLSQWLWASLFVCLFVGLILDDRLKGKLLKPCKGAHSSHFRVCPSVLARATEHTFFA